MKVRMTSIVFAICSISFSWQFSYGKDYVIDTDIKWKDQSDVPIVYRTKEELVEILTVYHGSRLLDSSSLR